MIKLSEIFSQLQYGELFNVALSGDIDAPKGIRAEDYPLLINHINLALTDLHTKFNIKEREVAVQQYDVLSYYRLNSLYAVSNEGSTEPYKYIIDTTDNPFTDDILRINSIYDEAGCELPINDENACNSVFLPRYDTIQVPLPYNDNTLFVLYRANHDKLDIMTIDPTVVDVNIPTYCIEPLLTYVASRVHGSRLNQESHALSVSLMNKYSLLCDQIEEKNMLYNNPNNTNIKLGARGWV